MKVSLNGEEREIPEGTTVSALLESLELPASRIAVERNRKVVPRERFGEVVLLGGDRIEVVRFVGGGNGGE